MKKLNIYFLYFQLICKTGVRKVRYYCSILIKISKFKRDYIKQIYNWDYFLEQFEYLLLTAHRKKSKKI